MSLLHKASSDFNRETAVKNDVPLKHEWKVPVLQELLSTRMNNLYVEGFDDYVITEMINMLCSE